MIEIMNQASLEGELEELRQRACGSCANAGGNECRYCALNDSRKAYWTEREPGTNAPGQYEKENVYQEKGCCHYIENL